MDAISRNDLPLAIESQYSIATPTGSIELYRGPLTLGCASSNEVLSGVVRLAWHPTPSLEARLQPRRWIGLEEPRTINLPGAVAASPIVPTRSSMSELEAHIDRIQLGRLGEPVSAVLFHLPNLPQVIRGKCVRFEGTHQIKAGRMEFEGAGWQVTLDPSRHLGTELERQLKTQRGHAMTYVGRLQRADGAHFLAPDASFVLSALTFLLTTVRGAWTGPMLLQGVDATHHVHWEDWGVPSVDPLGTQWSMMSNTEEALLRGVFPEFLARWADPVWQGALVAFSSLYRAANTLLAGIETSLVPALAALELLGWMGRQQVRARRRVTGRAGRPSAADRLSALLQVACIPTEIPATLPALREAAHERGWPDGPTAVTALRNAVTHPTAESLALIRATEVKARYEAWTLTMWYLDVLFLWFMGYKGPYASRTSDAQWSGQEVRSVPWAQ